MMAVLPVRGEPLSGQVPVNRGHTGNFRIFGPVPAIQGSQRLGKPRLLNEIPDSV